MKTAVSIVLLLAGLSAGAVGVGYLLRGRGEGAAAPTPQPTPSGSTAPVPTIAIGEPVGASGGTMYAGGSPTFDERGPGGFTLAGAAGNTPSPPVAAPAPTPVPSPADVMAEALARANDLGALKGGMGGSVLAPATDLVHRLDLSTWLSVVKPVPTPLPKIMPTPILRVEA